MSNATALGVYFKFTGTVFGFVDSVRINDDGTVSGRSVTRTYNAYGEGWFITYPVGGPGRTYIEQLRQYRDNQLWTLDISWTYTYYVSPIFPTGDNNYVQSSIHKVSIYGQEMWMFLRVATPSYGSWTQRTGL